MNHGAGVELYYNGINKFEIISDGIQVNGAVVMMASLPTSDPVNAGQLWNDSGTVKVSI